MSNFSQKWRKRWDLTQEMAADELDITSRTIRNYEALATPRMAEYAMRYLTEKWRGKVK